MKEPQIVSSHRAQDGTTTYYLVIETKVDQTHIIWIWIPRLTKHILFGYGYQD